MCKVEKNASIGAMENWLDCAELKKALQQGSVSATALWAQVESSKEALTKTGKPYRQVVLKGSDSSLMLRFWQDALGYDFVCDLQGEEWVAVSGNWQDNGYGPEVAKAEFRHLSDQEIETFLGGGEEVRQKQQQAWQEVQMLLASYQEPRLQKLVELFLAKYEQGFRRAAAASKFHHARRGGLLEHVAMMMKSADALVKVYPVLHRDLLLTGVFFHDCGKLWENPLPERGFTQTPQLQGEMLGHILIGVEVVNNLWRQLEASGDPIWQQQQPSSQDLKLHLLHLIGSHHGEHEWGSPVLPKTPEAIALHYIDNLDAKLEMFAQGYAENAQLAEGIYAPARPLRQRLIAPLVHGEAVAVGGSCLQETEAEVPKNSGVEEIKDKAKAKLVEDGGKTRERKNTESESEQESLETIDWVDEDLF